MDRPEMKEAREYATNIVNAINSGNDEWKQLLDNHTVEDIMSFFEYYDRDYGKIVKIEVDMPAFENWVLDNIICAQENYLKGLL